MLVTTLEQGSPSRHSSRCYAAVKSLPTGSSAGLEGVRPSTPAVAKNTFEAGTRLLTILRHLQHKGRPRESTRPS